MKRIAVLSLILLILLAGFFAPLNAGAITDARQNTHLIEPVAVAADGGRVFVAENSDSGTKLHIFSDTAPELTTISGEITGHIKKMRVSGNRIYMLQTNQITVFNLLSNKTEFALPANGLKAFDINAQKMYCVFLEGVAPSFTRVRETVLASITSSTNLTAGSPAYRPNQPEVIKEIAVNDTSLAAVFENGTVSTYSIYPSFSDENDDVPAAAENTGGILWAGNNVWTYSDKKINSKVIGDITIKDVAYVSDNELYLLDSDENRVLQYKYENSAFTATGVVLGSNYKSFDLPYERGTYLTGKNGFKIGKITGNEAYAYLPEKLSDSRTYGLMGSIATGTLVIVLGQVSGFSYVWLDGKFGFVDSRYIDDDNGVNNFTTDSGELKIPVTANQKLYFLPKNEAPQVAVANISKDTEITLLTKINTFDGGRWSFVSFTYDYQTVYGFMPNNSLTDIPEPVPTYEVYKANPPVLQTLNVYSSQDTDSPVIASIPSGDDVRVYEYGEMWSKVKVTADGNLIEGYVLSSQLIKSGLTNTLAAGIVGGIGLILCAVFLIIISKRRKKHMKTVSGDASIYTDLEKLD